LVTFAGQELVAGQRACLRASSSPSAANLPPPPPLVRIAAEQICIILLTTAPVVTPVGSVRGRGGISVPVRVYGEVVIGSAV
jgi:hypothetical protein